MTKGQLTALICSLLIGYLVGTLNPSYLIARRRGFDIRSKGSGNAGGSNALITMGKLTGVLCMLLDILKAYLCVRLTLWMFPTFAYTYAVTASACVLGHIFPFYMKGRGGKGLACLGGIALAFSPKIFLFIVAGEVVLLAITDYLVTVPVTACVVYPVVFGLVTRDAVSACILLPVTAAMLIKHIPNLKRIRNGTELRFHFLWKREEETARVMKNIEEKEKNS